ncbi:zinc ribbon domain-containing protein [Sulfobacillus thermosulfidooxidans]|uniref:RNA-guided endonuclease InsQ/TnpB family protein n=1 Tax=Sulfobacillus thermosulfidooxidans TaxID=28034 RepID=UPI0009F9BEFE
MVDASWNQLIQYTTYKAEEAGRRVVLVDPKNTSQLCSNCGEVVPKTLSERVHRCDYCGYVQDRDVNAAQNILKRGLAS